MGSIPTRFRQPVATGAGIVRQLAGRVSLMCPFAFASSTFQHCRRDHVGGGDVVAVEGGAGPVAAHRHGLEWVHAGSNEVPHCRPAQVMKQAISWEPARRETWRPPADRRGRPVTVTGPARPGRPERDLAPSPDALLLLADAGLERPVRPVTGGIEGPIYSLMGRLIQVLALSPCLPPRGSPGVLRVTCAEPVGPTHPSCTAVDVPRSRRDVGRPIAALAIDIPVRLGL